MMPFLTEVMYQNLKAASDNEESVHHCKYPVADASLIDRSLSAQTLVDEDLSEDMHALLRLVSLGSAARNSVKIKVRQPLAELRIQPGDERDRRAVERFAEQICEELNMKKVTSHDPKQGPLLQQTIKPNMKNLGPRMGPLLKEVQKALTAADAAAIAEKVGSGQAFELKLTSGETVTVEPTDVIVDVKAAEGWAGLADRKTQLALDTRITEDLQLEGLAREVVRHVQTARKDAGLDMADRIVLYLGTEDATLQSAIDKHRDYIAQETLVSQWAPKPLSGDGVYRTTVKVEGQPLTIELRRA
jgi:isoleucyl-tRNA synthetase